MKGFNSLKKAIVPIFAVVMVLLLTACGTNNGNIASGTDNSQSRDTGQSTKTLIAYFSHTGNTQKVAQIIQQQVGGDLFEIQTAEQYPSDRNALIETAQREQDNNSRPALNTHVDNINDYDVIFIGYPIWMGNMPMAIYTFLEEYDLSGKRVIPFCTNGGSGLSGTPNIISSIQPNARVTEGLSVLTGNVDTCEEDVVDWLRNIGISQSSADGETDQNDQVGIRFNFNGKTATAVLERNPASESLIGQLPTTVTFNDYSSAEKIAYFNNSLSEQGSSSGYDPQVGDIACYGPWGNMAIYYRDQPYDRGLIYMGKIESGLDSLAAIGDGTSVAVEIVQ